MELGEESATIEWARVYKVTHFMGLTLLYTGKQQAFVFPDYELGDDREKMLDYMKEHIKEARKKAVQTQTDGGDISKYWYDGGCKFYGKVGRHTFLRYR